MREPNSTTIVASDTGAVLGILLVMLTAILIFAAISIDSGWLVIVRNEAQLAVDSAALAGTGGIPFYNSTGDRLKIDSLATGFNGSPQQATVNTVMSADPAIAIEDITPIVWRNGAAQIPTTPSEANGVRVTKVYQVPYLFSQVMGLQGQSLTVSATAIASYPSCQTAELPFALLDCQDSNGIRTCSPPACGTLKTVALANPSQSDNMGFFVLEGQSANASLCRASVIQGRPIASLCTGIKLELNNGVIADCLREIEDKCNSLDCSESNPWEVNVPTLDCDTVVQFNQSAAVLGFARVGITAVNSRGNPKSISFKILCDRVATESSPGTGQGCGLFNPPTLVE